MFTSKWCNDNLNASSISWRAVKAELFELLEARSLEEIKEEFSDVMYFTLCAIQTSTGISLPMSGSSATIYKVIHRLSVWEEIFNKEGLKFNKKYLVNGSNYKKIKKVELALELARKDQLI